MDGWAALPVKNTFIHFNIKDADIPQLRDTAEDRDSSPVASEQLPIFWLPSLSSSSDDRRRPSSVGVPPSSSSENSTKAAIEPLPLCERRPLPPRPTPQWRPSATVNTARPQALLPREREAAQRSVQGQAAASDWGQNLFNVLQDIWHGRGPMSAATAAASSSSTCAAEQHPSSAEEGPASAVDSVGRCRELLARIPRNERGELTSIGSIGHEAGQCNACPFWFKGVCLNGLACRNCHFLHDGQRPRRLRPSKQARERLRKRAQNKDSGDDAVEEAEQSLSPGYSPSKLAEQLALEAENMGLTVAKAAGPRQCAAMTRSL
mmetsp:Transcript_80355/g.186589  ORF Transcript_80355/g.186589 Transcript_80355/m.186589 type:complete len:320 (-) Transcript_80355:111-1070(-)